jgi:hypothetical protein
MRDRLLAVEAKVALDHDRPCGSSHLEPDLRRRYVLANYFGMSH